MPKKGVTPTRKATVPAARVPSQVERTGRHTVLDEAVATLRALADAGLLSETVRTATAEERVRLTGAAYSVAWPVVFHRLTRVHELHRGHRSCTLGVHRLTDACLDRFYEDLEAVVEDVLTHATVAIQNLEGWITSRLQAATVDAHRRRRGARGALQRPRLPGWLGQGLGHDRWLGQLAVEILIWVGVPTTAGTSLWPLDAWVERRGAVTGDWTGSDTRTVEREIEHVLAVMRRRPGWYAEHVERPLGTKTPPVAPALVDRGVIIADPPALAMVEAHEIAEARLTELANVALATIRARLADNHDVHATVASVITTVFGDRDLSGTLADLPHTTSIEDEHVSALVADSAELERIIMVVRHILDEEPGAAGA